MRNKKELKEIDDTTTKDIRNLFKLKKEKIKQSKTDS